MPPPPPPPAPPPPPSPAAAPLELLAHGAAPDPEQQRRPLLTPADMDRLRAVGLEDDEALAFATDEEIYGAGLGAVGIGRVLRERETLQARLFRERWQGQPASAVAADEQQDGCATFACGSDVYGRLGHGTYEEHRDTFTAIDAFAGTRLRAMESGAAHVIALTAEGRVFTWGKAHMHQVSFSTESKAGCVDVNRDARAAIIARRVRAMESWSWPLTVGAGLVTEPVHTIAAGWHHCLALTQSGVLHGWGSLRGLGIGQPVSAGDFRRATPVVIEIEGLKAPIATLAAGGHGNAGGHSIVCDAEGNVFCWGDNSCGQLGLGSTEETVWCPRPCKAVAGMPVAKAA
jgi:hypothetical protein